MEYIIILFIQILIMSLILFGRKDNARLIKKLDSTFLIVMWIFQGLCIIGNVVLLFVAKDMMMYVLEFHVFIAGIILMIFDPIGKRLHFQRLTNILIEDNLISLDTGSIRRYIVEKYGLIYSTKEIDKYITKIIENQKKIDLKHQKKGKNDR